MDCPFGFYGKPVIKKVEPLRSGIINSYRRSIKTGKYDVKLGVPKFSNFHEIRDKYDFEELGPYDINRIDFTSNENYENVMNCMKEGQNPLSDAITNKTKVYFEQKPIQFNTYQPKLPQKLMNLMKAPNGIQDIKNAVNKVDEIQKYDNLVRLSFQKGVKPPVKLSDHEQNQIQIMIEKFEINQNKNNGLKKFNFGESKITNVHRCLPK